MIGVIMFILGGFVSAIIFYPRKQRVDIDRLAYYLSFQSHYGMWAGQQTDCPVIEEDAIPMLAEVHKHMFIKPTTIILKEVIKW
jgi:hypothetical protein